MEVVQVPSLLAEDPRNMIHIFLQNGAWCVVFHPFFIFLFILIRFLLEIFKFFAFCARRKWWGRWLWRRPSIPYIYAELLLHTTIRINIVQGVVPAVGVTIQRLRRRIIPHYNVPRYKSTKLWIIETGTIVVQSSRIQFLPRKKILFHPFFSTNYTEGMVGHGGRNVLGFICYQSSRLEVVSMVVEGVRLSVSSCSLCYSPCRSVNVGS